MSAALPEDQPLRISASYRMQWEPAQNCDVLLYPEGMVKLNAAASEILSLCDGSRDLHAILGELFRKFPGADLEQDVRDFLGNAHQRGWISVG